MSLGIGVIIGLDSPTTTGSFARVRNLPIFPVEAIRFCLRGEEDFSFALNRSASTNLQRTALAAQEETFDANDNDTIKLIINIDNSRILLTVYGMLLFSHISIDVPAGVPAS